MIVELVVAVVELEIDVEELTAEAVVD